MTVLLAAETPTPPIPGTMTGILHPKVSNRFRVLYTVAAKDGEDHDQIAMSMRFLAMQTVAVSLPAQRLNTVVTATGPARKFLKNIDVTGDLVLTIEDDVGHAAARSLQYLLDRADVQLEVQLMDGAEQVVEILLYGRCKAKLLQRAVLDYSIGTAIRHTLTVQVGYAQHGVLTPAQSQEI